MQVKIIIDVRQVAGGKSGGLVGYWSSKDDVFGLQLGDSNCWWRNTSCGGARWYLSFRKIAVESERSGVRLTVNRQERKWSNNPGDLKFSMLISPLPYDGLILILRQWSRQKLSLQKITLLWKCLITKIFRNHSHRRLHRACDHQGLRGKNEDRCRIFSLNDQT